MNNKAFTLIELLVVVLIIGILSAIAFPQYERAVEKSRVATALPVLKSLRDAADVYSLETKFAPWDTNFMEFLDVSIPQSNCWYSIGSTKYENCDTDMIFGAYFTGSSTGGSLAVHASRWTKAGDHLYGMYFSKACSASVSPYSDCSGGTWTFSCSNTSKYRYICDDLNRTFGNN